MKSYNNMKKLLKDLKDSKIEKGESVILDESRCECGASIPRGYGYYNYGYTIKCKMCGRINKK